MTRTPTLPIDDHRMWRLLVGRAHPDTGGDHELFIWTVATRDTICGGEAGVETLRIDQRDHRPWRREASTANAGDRVPFDEDASFEFLTDRAVTMAEAVAEPYAHLLRQVVGCYPAEDGPLYRQQRRGASYRSLAAIGHQVGMTKDERAQWYRIAEAVPLSQRHAGHILSRLKGRAA